MVPFIQDEEEKLAQEPGKILGQLRSSSAGEPSVAPADLRISAQCFRVPVTVGHTLSVSVKLQGEPSSDEIRAVWMAEPASSSIRYLDELDRPQPRLDRDFQGGMGVSVGRLRDCPVLGHRFVVLSHNMVRGAAGGALSTAEAALRRGLMPV